jgi:hypothetical protein
MGCSAAGNLGVREAVPILVPAPLAVEGISPLKKFQGLLKSSIDKKPLCYCSPLAGLVTSLYRGITTSMLTMSLISLG